MNLLQIGFGREDFTPTEFPISNNSTRYVTEVGDSIFASCLALRWEDLTVLQFSLDLRNLYDKDYARVLAVIAEKTGIPPECILLSATHNHSAPDISLNDRPDIDAWEKKIGLPAMCRAAERALADLAPVTGAEGGRAETKKLSFVRRYFREDGSFYGIASPKSTSPLARSESRADPELRAVRIHREGKKSVVLVNFQTHAASGQGSHPTQIHADFVGELRKKVEADGESLLMYLQGACGNVNCNANLPEDREGWPGDCFHIGRKMAEDVAFALENAKPLSLDRLVLIRDELTCRVNHKKTHLAEIAKEIQKNPDKEERKKMMAEAGIENRYEVSAIIKRSAFGETRQMPLSALILGDLAMGFAPVELFDTCGKEFRDASRYPMTFFCGYTNGSHSYMPSALAFPNGGYEALECHYVPGTGEMIALKLLEMIHRS
ncbi:MAG: hypothetical protein IKD31_02210 [Clostridia bacterium]|nr:hypothetical protein [Clostridia bacterium]